MAKKTVTAEDISAVYEAWLSHQANPHLCRFTEDRKTLIRRTLQQGYSVEDLQILMRYAFEAKEPGPRFWRCEEGSGNTNGKTYTDLSNLLVISKLGKRVIDALTWAQKKGITSPPAAPQPELSLASPSQAKPQPDLGLGVAPPPGRGRSVRRPNGSKLS